MWVNPWYPSPMADAGYDVSDYRAVEPRFGTVEEAQQMVAEAHDLGLRVLIDIVPNHSSVQHAWFQAALRAGAGSPERERYVFRRGTGPHGDRPPNDWTSVYGTSAWERVTEPDGSPGEWYLHLFTPEQPDLNWDHPEVRGDFVETLRFWFDRGVDGFRIDVAHSLVKEPGLPDVGGREFPPPMVEVDGVLRRDAWQDHPHWDRDEVHDIYRDWRRLADSYADPKVFVAEAWVDEPDRLVRYVREDELHTAFNVTYLQCPWVAEALREAIDETLAEHESVGAPPTWVLSNHDVVRHVSRYARPQDRTSIAVKDLVGVPADLELGRRRSRAAVLLTLALPGGAYVYQGEELGLEEIEDLPQECLQDPTWQRSGHTDPGRDGCRVPVPWSGDGPPYGFSTPDATSRPWLPQPEHWAELTAERQTGDPASMLELYRSALGRRRRLDELGDGSLEWLDTPDGSLGFARGDRFVCLVNLGAEPFAVPDGEILLCSGHLEGGLLDRDTAVWLRR